MLIARIGRFLWLRISKNGISARVNTFRMKTRSSICASCGVNLVSRRAFSPRRGTIMGARGGGAGRTPSRDTVLAIGNTALQSQYGTGRIPQVERRYGAKAP